MVLPRRSLIAILSLIIVVAFGVIGYRVIEGWSFLDALYMTVITLTTYT
jgi:voltage-gated potassium channel